ncbi:MAG TPA: hypothetical protein PLE16_10465 [Spirochaetota bacterium]|nr:hypothetical protein [Spirochaetota bacterium]
MKKTFFALSALLLFAACGAKTELAIKNGEASEDKISKIVWAEGDANWGDEEVGINSVSSSKEVNETTGLITCGIFNGTDYDEATVVSEETKSDVVSIDEGSSNVVTITVVKP